MVARTRIALYLLWYGWLFSALIGLPMLAQLRPPQAIGERFPAGALRVGIDPSYPPFANHVEGGFVGLDIDLGEALAVELDLAVQFIPLGYDGLYDALKTDHIDILLAGVRVDYRQSQDVVYSQPYMNGGLRLLSPKTAALIRRNDLSSHKIAYGYGTAADQFLWYAEREIAPFQRAPYEDEETALRALKQGQVSAALVDGVEGLRFMRWHGDWLQELALTEDHLAIAMRRDRPWLHSLIHDALSRLWVDGRLSEILQGWLWQASPAP